RGEQPQYRTLRGENAEQLDAANPATLEGGDLLALLLDEERRHCGHKQQRHADDLCGDHIKRKQNQAQLLLSALDDLVEATHSLYAVSSDARVTGIALELNTYLIAEGNNAIGDIGHVVRSNAIGVGVVDPRLRHADAVVGLVMRQGREEAISC